MNCTLKKHKYICKVIRRNIKLEEGLEQHYLFAQHLLTGGSFLSGVNYSVTSKITLLVMGHTYIMDKHAQQTRSEIKTSYINRIHLST